MSFQIKWKYLKRDAPGVGTLMGPIGEALRETFFSALLGGEEVDADFQKILGNSVKRGGLGILDPRLSAESEYNTSKATSGGIKQLRKLGIIMFAT